LSCLDRIDGSENRPSNQGWQRVRRQRLVERLHRLGPYPLWHFLRAIEGGAPIWPTLEEYAALDANFIAALGGRDFPPLFHTLGGGAG
jgi:hypothetical protein